MIATKEQLTDPSWWRDNAPARAGLLVQNRHTRYFAWADSYRDGSYYSLIWGDGVSPGQGELRALDWHILYERPVAQWTGPQDGLPPVGTVCEVVRPGFNHPRFNRFIGQKVFVVAHDTIDGTPVAVFRAPVDGDPREQEYHSMVAAAFRPVETSEQKAASERRNSINAALLAINSVGHQTGYTYSVVEALYDAGLLLTEVKP